MSKRKRNKKAKPQFPTAKIKTGKTQEERRDKIHHHLFIGFVVLYVLHYTFIAKETIGHDDRYQWYIFFTPTLLGAFLLTLYQRKYIGDFFAKELKGWSELAIGFLLSSIMAFTLSYLIFGNLANITWEYLNTQKAKQHMPEAFYCPITQFVEGKHDQIRFRFNGKSESVRTSYKTIEPYLEVNPADYQLEVIVRKGIWNYYVVEDWKIKSIKNK